MNYSSSNINNVKALIMKIEARSGGFRISDHDYIKLNRLNDILIGSAHTEVLRWELVSEYRAKKSKRDTHLEIINRAKNDEKRQLKTYRQYKELSASSENNFKIHDPVLWSCQCIPDDTKHTNVVRRINESLENGVITGRELIRLYKVVGIRLSDRRILSKRLSESGLIKRKLSTKHLENLVKFEILKLNTRIAGTKIDKLTLVSETLQIPLDEILSIYKKLSTQESIDRRNKRIVLDLSIS